jgi:hypothetical protein
MAINGVPTERASMTSPTMFDVFIVFFLRGFALGYRLKVESCFRLVVLHLGDNNITKRKRYGVALILLKPFNPHQLTERCFYDT